MGGCGLVGHDSQGMLGVEVGGPHVCGIHGGTRALVIGASKSLIEAWEACGKTLCDSMHLLLRQMKFRGHVGEISMVVEGCW